MYLEDGAGIEPASTRFQTGTITTFATLWNSRPRFHGSQLVPVLFSGMTPPAVEPTKGLVGSHRVTTGIPCFESVFEFPTKRIIPHLHVIANLISNIVIFCNILNFIQKKPSDGSRGLKCCWRKCYCTLNYIDLQAC